MNPLLLQTAEEMFCSEKRLDAEQTRGTFSFLALITAIKLEGMFWFQSADCRMPCLGSGFIEVKFENSFLRLRAFGWISDGR